MSVSSFMPIPYKEDAVEKSPISTSSKPAWRPHLPIAMAMNKWLCALLLLFVLGGIAVGLYFLIKFETSSSSSRGFSAIPLPSFVMSVATPQAVAPNSLTTSNLVDTGCNGYSFQVPDSTGLGIQHSTTFGYVAYQANTTITAGRMVPSPAVNFGSGAFSLNAWVNLAIIGSSVDLVVFGPDVASDGPGLVYDTRNSLGWALFDASNVDSTPAYVSTGLIGTNANTWNMVTLTYNPAPGTGEAQYIIYVNGQAMGSIVKATHTDTFTSGLSIMNWAGITGLQLIGSIYEPSAWLGVVLNSTSIQTLYDAASISDLYRCG